MHVRPHTAYILKFAFFTLFVQTDETRRTVNHSQWVILNNYQPFWYSTTHLSPIIKVFEGSNWYLRISKSKIGWFGLPQIISGVRWLAVCIMAKIDPVPVNITTIPKHYQLVCIMAKIDQIVARACTRANFVHKCFISRDTNILTRAFVVYVRPLLEYGSSVWSTHHAREFKQAESVQTRFTKRLPGLKYLHYHERLQYLGLETLEMRRLRQDLVIT